MSRRHGGGSFEVELDGTTYRIRLVESDPEAYDRFYNVIANPMLWFIQHYLWDLSNAPDIRRAEVEAYEQGYCVVNEDLARAVLEEVEERRAGRGDAPRLPPLHGAEVHPRGAPRRLPPPLRPHPLDPAGRLARAARATCARTSTRASSSNDIVAFHTRSYRRNFLLCCRELFDLDVDEDAGVVHFDGREVWVRAYPLPISAETFQRNAQRADGARVRARDPAPPARAPDPARGPRGPVEERPARLHGLRPLPRAAPGVPRAGHLHRAPDPVAPGRARVRRVPRADRGAGGRGQPPPRDHRLDADRPAPAREPARRRSPPTSTTTC